MRAILESPLQDSHVVQCRVERYRTPSVAFGATSLNFALTRKREAFK